VTEVRDPGRATTPSAVPEPGTFRSSVILATLNERSNLPALVDRIRRLNLSRSEVLVVDDGSVDGTREYVASLAVLDPSIRLLRHEGKQTTLRAQRQGLESARGEFIVVMDADLQHPPELIPSLLNALDKGAALSVASRYAAGGSAGPRTLTRWTLSRGAEWLTKILLPSARGISDPVSGFFAFRREIWRPFNPLYRGYKLLLFLLVMAEGRPIREVGFHFTPRAKGASKVTGSAAFLRVFLTELILARRFRARVRLGASAQTESGSTVSRVTLLP
jgi:dolichol-phosphate mannosyltransferase